jgi:hypothetical protein
MNRKNKWRYMASALALCLLFCCFSLLVDVSAAGTCFIALNDELLTLDNSPYFSSSVTYVPYRVFQQFGIYATYFSSDNILLLYNSETQLFFDLNSDNVYDGNGNYYSNKAISRSTGIYVPVNFVCGIFGGLTATYVNGNAYGDVVRITDGSQILSDQQFVSAASLLMRSYYNAYYGITPTPAPTASVPDDPVVTTPSVTEDPVSPSPSSSPAQMNTTVSLNFIGLPSDPVLNCLDAHNVRACFFVTEDDIMENPALLRRLSASGHRIGLYCTEDPSIVYETCMPLLYECSREVAMLLAADDTYDAAASLYADNSGLIYCSFDLTIDSNITANQITEAIADSQSAISIIFTRESNADSLISAVCDFIETNKIPVQATVEVSA